MTITSVFSRWSTPVFALGAALLLGACGGGSVGGQLAHLGAERDPPPLRSAEAEGRVADAAEIREAVDGTQRRLAEVRRDLQADSDAGTVADEALAAVDEALLVADAALVASDAIASGGLISFASVQATVDPLVTKLDEAKREVDSALGAVDSTTRPTLHATLTEASDMLASLKTALSTKLEDIRRELADARKDLADVRADASARQTLTLPDGLDATLAAGTFTIAAGANTVRTSTQAGDGSAVEFRCPAGGKACRVRVYANGEIGYWGGTPAAWPSPARSALWAEVVPGVRLPSGSTTLTVNRVKRLFEILDEYGQTRDIANPSRLAVATAPVAYSASSTATTPSVGKPTVELPLRAVTLRDNGAVQGGHFHDAGPWSAADPWKNTDANVESSIQLREDGGVVLKVRGTAGEGLLYGDMASEPGVPPGAGRDGKVGDPNASYREEITPAQAEELGVVPGGLLNRLQEDQLHRWSNDNCHSTRDDAGLCYDHSQEDLEITFGKSSGDPERDTAAYWSARVPFKDPDDVTELRTPPALDGEYHDYGSYDLYVSRYAGLDAGADAGSTTDDTHRYLDYAAYGLFRFTDNWLVKPRPGRIQGFHFGFDAFRDVAGSRTTDADSLATTALQATFKGRAMGWDLRDGAEYNTRDYVDPGAPGLVGPMVRLRGDVTLDACVGGTGAHACVIPADPADPDSVPLSIAANTIKGVIENFEFYFPGTDNWLSYNAGDLARVVLKGERNALDRASIAADGSFRGVAYGEPSERWGDLADINDYEQFGEYSGTFYGPRGPGMEAAGWWRVAPDDRPIPDGSKKGTKDERGNITKSLGLVGSFGAKCTAGCAPASSPSD